jgi:aryl-alcohol dehydrogenase-like predicted oxidoreductase
LGSNEISEEVLRKAIRKYNFRHDNIVIATQLLAPVIHVNRDKLEDPMMMSVEERDRNGYITSYGLSRKHIFDSVDASLKRLELDYIDLLQIQRFDPSAPAKEAMKALYDIVKKGGTSMAIVAIAWSLSKLFMTSPIIGMSKDRES